jgi:CubicO group peptidase (beta-lactamase class C family)
MCLAAFLAATAEECKEAPQYSQSSLSTLLDGAPQEGQRDESPPLVPVMPRRFARWLVVHKSDGSTLPHRDDRCRGWYVGTMAPSPANATGAIAQKRRTRVPILCAALLASVVLQPIPLQAGAGLDAGPVADANAMPEAVGSVDAAAPTAWASNIGGLVEDALAEHKLPGCVVVIGRASGVIYGRAFGYRALLPDKEPMTEDTIFDLASLTKPIATATSLMVLADQGKVDLDERVLHYLPEFASRGKDAITLRQLLTHVSGLPSETPIADYEHGRAEAMKKIMALRPKAAPGERFVYSDVGYIVLQEVIRRVTKTRLDAFADRFIFRPLDMTDTRFLPPASERSRIAPTEQRNGEWMRGEVHDPRAYRLGGVAGNAGLFSTAADLARFARMVLGRGTLEGTTVLSERAMTTMLAPHDIPGGIRAIGWDVQTGYSSNRGTSLSRRAIGHGGYTGTSLWIDPDKDLFVIFLSNRVHPDGKGAMNALAAAIATLAGKAFAPPEPVEDSPSPAGPGHRRTRRGGLRAAARPALRASHQRQRAQSRRRPHHRRSCCPSQSQAGCAAQPRARPVRAQGRTHQGRRGRKDAPACVQPVRGLARPPKIETGGTPARDLAYRHRRSRRGPA